MSGLKKDAKGVRKDKPVFRVTTDFAKGRRYAYTCEVVFQVSRDGGQTWTWTDRFNEAANTLTVLRIIVWAKTQMTLFDLRRDERIRARSILGTKKVRTYRG